MESEDKKLTKEEIAELAKSGAIEISDDELDDVSGGYIVKTVRDEHIYYNIIDDHTGALLTSASSETAARTMIKEDPWLTKNNIVSDKVISEEEWKRIRMRGIPHPKPF